jgi:dienelactone hydrolase
MKNCWKFVVGFGAAALATASQAQTNPFAKGPDPSQASIQADGPFAISSQTVDRVAQGFGGATVYSPNTAGTYALVVLCPGFLEGQNAISDVGQRLATHGFVVATIDTLTRLDFPSSRATQLLSAVQTVSALNTGPVAGKIDTSRIVVGGHSMGGGGTLEASATNPAIKAGLPIAPFHFVRQFDTSVPQLISGGSSDNIAPPGAHSIPFFEMLPDATPKIYAELAGAGHFFVSNTPPNQPINKFLLSWTKRFADNDLRYEQFVTAEAVQVEVANGNLSQTRREGTPF